MVVCNHRSDFVPDVGACGAAILRRASEVRASGPNLLHFARTSSVGLIFRGARATSPCASTRSGPAVTGARSTGPDTGQLLASTPRAPQKLGSIAIFPEGNRLGAYVDKTIEAGKHPTKLMPFKPPFFDCARKK